MATRFDQIVGQYLNDPQIGGAQSTVTQQKQREILTTASEKQVRLGGPAPESGPGSYYNLAAVQDHQRGYSTVTDPVQRDLLSRDNWQLFNRYGSNVDRIFAQSVGGANRYSTDARTPTTVRGSADRGQDVGLGFVQGVVNSTLGIGALGLGLVDNEAGTWAANKIGQLNQSLEESKSANHEARSRVFSENQLLDNADNEEQFQRDQANDGEFVASLKRIGRDTWTSTRNVLRDPAISMDTVSQGTGSLVTAGPISKGLGLVGKAVLRGAMDVGAVGFSGARTALTAGRAAAVPASVGLMEGGGAYQQTVADALARLEDRTDLSHEEKVRMANMAGLQAAAIQAPVGALTGTLVSKFEGDLAHVPGFRAAAGNAVRETVEEATQGASGQLAQNLAIRHNVDGTQSLSEGIGEQIGQGAIGGFGSAVGVSVPQAAARATVRGTKAAAAAIVGGATGALAAVNGRADTVRTRAEAASPIAPEVINPQVAQATQNAPIMRQQVTDAIQSNKSTTPEQKTQAQSTFDNLFNYLSFSDQEADNQPSPVLADVLRGSPDRSEAMTRAADFVLNEKTDPKDRLAAGLFLMQNDQQHAVTSDLRNEAIEALPDDHPLVPAIQQFEDVVGLLRQRTDIKKAIEQAADLKDVIKPVDVSDEQISTPAGQQAARTAVDLAALNPQNSNPAVNTQILYHATQGRIQLTPEQQGYLASANALKSAEDRYVTETKRLGLNDTEVVSRQIQTDENDPNTLHKSAISHMDGIVAAVRAGHNDLATRRLKHLMAFAQSMQNKVQALNENLLAGDGSDKRATPYEAYNPRTGEFFKSKTPVYLNGEKQGSVKLAQHIAVDADNVGYLANELTTAFPQLGVKSIPLVPLHPSMSQGPAREAARDYAIAKRDGKLDQHLGVSSSVKTPEQVLTETKQDDAKEFERQSNEERASVKDAVDNNRPAVSLQTEDRSPPRPSEPAEPVKQVQDEKPRPSPDPVQPEQATPVPTDPSSVEPAVQKPSENSVSSVPAASAASAIDQTYPDLLGSNGEKVKSPFKQAFSLPKGETPISRLTGRDDGVAAVREGLSSPEAFRELTGDEKTAKKLKPEISRAYSLYLRLAGDLGKAMNARLNPTDTKKAAKHARRMDRLANDETVIGDPENRALAISELIDGKLSYNRELQQNAVLAGLQWMLTMDQQSRTLDAEDVGKILGIPETDVTDPQIKAFNNGVYYGDAVIDLSNMIQRFWGVKTNRDAPLGFTKGIPEGVAKEVIESLSEMRTAQGNKILTIHEAKILGKTYYQISFDLKNAAGFKDNVYSQVIKMPSAIEQAVVTEPVQATYVDATPPKRAATQLRNHNVSLTDEQVRMRANEEKTSHFADLPMVSLVQSLGSLGAQILFGHGDLSKLQLNKQHRESMESVNKGIAAAVEMADRTMAEIANVAGDRELDQVPVRYAYDFTSVNRLQMSGRQNPQANKITRELFMPTRSTLDLSDPESDDMGRFMLGLAQAFGIKVHKQSRSTSVQQVRERVAGPYAETIQAIRDWNQKGEAGRALDGHELAEKIRSTLEPKGNPPSVVAVHALMEYARLLDQEDRSKFTTSMYVEADGVTDGPINAMVHFARGKFTQSWLNIVRKGGLFPGQSGMTINEFSQTDQGRSDLYQQTTDYLKQELVEFENALRDNAPVFGQLQGLKTLMGQLGLDVTLNDNGDLVIDRGAVKNPLTVKIYGAGDKGIANKISSLLIKAVYERESEILQDPKNKQLTSYRQALSALAGNRVLKGKDGLSLQSGDRVNFQNAGENFELSPEQTSNISENVLQLWMPSMSKAISRSIGETETSVSLIQKATQVMSLAFRQAYLQGIQDKLDAKEKQKLPGWKRSHFLSEQELQEVYEANKHLAPYIQTGSQNILVGGGDRTPLLTSSEKTAKGEDPRAVVFSKTLDEQRATSGYVTAPGDAGVSGIPFLTIATGDGQMMQTYSSEYGQGGKHLLIFDGANFALDQLEQGSRDINQAVHEGWMRNPLGDLSKAYDAFLKSWNQAESNVDLTKVLGETTPEELGQQLTLVADEIAGRKKVLSQIGTSIDHMASAEAPYVAEAVGNHSVAGLDDVEMIQRMNDMLEDKIAEPKKASDQPLTIVEGNGILKSVINQSKDIFVRQLAQKIAQSGYKILSGSLSDLAAHVRAATGHQVPPTGSIQGFFSLSNKSIYLANSSVETLVHEMLHAATIEQIHDFYANQGKSLSDDQRAAIQRIENLQTQWLEQTSSAHILADGATYDAREAILDRLNNRSTLEATRKTGALSEFIAWNLSNQELIQKGKEQPLLSKIVSEVLKAFRGLIVSMGLGSPNANFYEALRFNTAVLLQQDQPVADQLSDLVLYQSTSFGTNDRTSQLRQQFLDKIGRYIHEQPNPARKLQAGLKNQQAQSIRIDIADSFEAAGFLPDMQSKSTFGMMVQAFALNIRLDPNSVSRLQELYAHVSKQLSVETFMSDPIADQPADRYQAQQKYNRVLGADLVHTDEQGRSTVLPAFLALSAVDENFRDLLAKMDLPKGESLPNNGMDNILTNVGNESMEWLGQQMAGEKRNTPSVGAAIDEMTDRLADLTRDEKSWIAQLSMKAGEITDAANTWVTDQMTNLSNRADKKLDEIGKNTNRKVVKLGTDVGQVLLGIVNKDIASANAESIVSAANQFSSSKTLNEFLGEMVGRTKSNASIYDMIKEVRSMVAAIRQRYRENLPKIIAESFDRPITDQEWTHLYDGLGRTDLASLTSGYSVDEIMKLATDPNKVQVETLAIEGRLNKGANGALVLGKAKQLADYMNTGRVGHNLLRNARIIAQLHGVSVGTAGEVQASYVQDIDHLISLYALQGLSQEKKDALSSLVQEQDKGVRFLLSYLNGQRNAELDGIDTRGDRALFNHWKGYIPSIQNGKAIGRSLVVASDAEYLKLKELGYERVGDYPSAKAENNAPKKGYYFVGVSGRSGFSQGILQTVHTTVSGIDPVTGRSTQTLTAGAITDPQEVQSVERRLQRPGLRGGQELMPVYDVDNFGMVRVVAYERSIDPGQIERLGRSTNIADMLGVWRGRQREEALALSVNKELVGKLHDMWNSAGVTQKGEFINVMDKREQKRDPVMADAVRLIPREARAQIKDAFGRNEFWVRKDLLNNALGYRKASLGDQWTGNTRFSEETQNQVKNLATAAFGVKAYTYLVKAEKVLENFVSDAKATIVVRSVIVPVANIVSNMYQLAANGVPLVNAVRAMPRKTAETESYVKGLIRTIQIEADLRVAQGAKDIVSERKLTTEDTTIRDSWKRMSIWPLIEAGELNSISDTGIGKEELDLAEGKLSEYVEKLVEKLPPQLKSIGRQLHVNTDTALFKGLQKAVDYGDFLAKSVLYDDMVQRRGMSQEEALAHITEEFVNYNYLSGRTMDKMDSLGVFWFWRFKVRSVKVALRMIRENPVHTMLSMLVPHPPLIGSVGSPITDNFMSVLADGKLGYSIGPGQGLRAQSMNPYAQLFGISI